jgi:hypothetical protein
VCSSDLGAAYMAVQCARQWLLALYEWRRLALTTRTPRGPTWGEADSSALIVICFVAAPVLPLFLVGSRPMPVLLPGRVWQNVAALIFAASAPVWLACLGVLYRDLKWFTTDASAAAGDGLERVRGHAVTRALAYVLGTCVVAAAVITGIQWGRPLAAAPLFGWSLLLLPFAAVATAGLVAVTPAVLALSLDRAAACLEACVEVSPEQPASPVPRKE